MQAETPTAGTVRVARLAVLIAGLLLPAGALAQLTDNDNPFRFAPDCFVYFSNDGDGFYDFARVLPVGSYSLDLYATGGATTTAEPDCSPPNQPGTGEICFLDVVIQKSGGGSLDSWTFESGITGGSTVSPGTVTLNVSAGTGPLAGGFVPQRIGTLGVTIASNTVVNLASGTCIGLGNEPRNMATHTMFLPEPGQYLLLASALLGLAGLNWLKLRRDAQRVASRR